MGKGRLLEHFAYTDAEDGFYDHLVEWLRHPPNHEMCSLLLRAIARRSAVLELLPPAPDLEPGATLYERTIGWFEEAVEAVGVRAGKAALQPFPSSTPPH